MNIVVLSLATQVGTLPSGTTAGKFRFVITGASGSLTQDESGPNSTFTSVTDDSGSATCQRLDQNGSPFGNVASCSWGLTPPATFDEPSMLSATVTPQ